MSSHRATADAPRLLVLTPLSVERAAVKRAIPTADIIRTVAVQPSLENVAVLGLIIFIRTFLSFSLEVELDGRWPWARGSGTASGPT